MFTSLDTVKQHLNIDPQFDADNDYLYHLIQAAEDATAKRMCVNHLAKLVDKHTGYLPDSVQHTILLLIGDWYNNRENTTSISVNKLPYSFDFLCDLNKSYKTKF